MKGGKQMIQNIAECIIKEFIAQDIIEASERETYVYGAQLVISTLISIGGALVISLFMGKVVESIIFLICYCGVRLYAGGYHANSYKYCICIFESIVTICLLLCDSIRLSCFQFGFILIVSNCILALKAPVEANNNPIPDSKKKNMKCKSIIVINLFFIILNRFLRAMKISYFNIGILAILWSCIIVVMGIVKNERGKCCGRKYPIV